MSNLGKTYALLGELGRAIGYYEPSLAIGRAISDPRIVSACEHGLKWCRDNLRRT